MYNVCVYDCTSIIIIIHEYIHVYCSTCTVYYMYMYVYVYCYYTPHKGTICLFVCLFDNGRFTVVKIGQGRKYKTGGKRKIMRYQHWTGVLNV